VREQTCAARIHISGSIDCRLGAGCLHRAKFHRPRSRPARKATMDGREEIRGEAGLVVRRCQRVASRHRGGDKRVESGNPLSRTSSHIYLAHPSSTSTRRTALPPWRGAMTSETARRLRSCGQASSRVGPLTVERSPQSGPGPRATGTSATSSRRQTTSGTLWRSGQGSGAGRSWSSIPTPVDPLRPAPASWSRRFAWLW
jgi:hypothetical protein